MLALFPQLVNARYYDDTKFFELLNGTSQVGSSNKVKLVRGGVQGNPAVGRPWRERPVDDDPWPPSPPGLSNRKGTVALAQPQDGDRSTGRSTQFVIQLSDNGEFFDTGKITKGLGTVPMGEVVNGIEILESMVEQHSTGVFSSDDMEKLLKQGDRFLSSHDSDLPYIHAARFNTQFLRQQAGKEL